MIGLGVVTYSRPEYLSQCLASLEKNNWGGATCVVVSVDFKDSQTSNQLITIAQKYPKICIIVHNENIGVEIGRAHV